MCDVYSLIRPLLFLFPPEWAHLLTLKMLACYGYLSIPQNSGDVIEIAGLRCKNRVGLAAGFDKDGIAVRGLANLGFGFIELGAVTPRLQYGNSRPRLFRLKNDQAIINRLGFNNDGVDSLFGRLNRDRTHIDIPIGVNIGKNRETDMENSIADYVHCLRVLAPCVDFVTVNVSSPNTPQLRKLQSRPYAKPLLEQVLSVRNQLTRELGNRVSVFLKISPDLEDETLASLCQIVREVECDGIIVANTTLQRPELFDKSRDEEGGLSGKPLFPITRHVVSRVREFVGPEFPIIGVGGISDSATAREMYHAGADLVQCYTSLVYRGPRCIRELAKVRPMENI